MFRQIVLSLMMGLAIPTAVDASVIEALNEVKVIIGSDTSSYEPTGFELFGSGPSDSRLSGFELSFSLDKGSPLETLFLLSQGAMIPLLRVVIAVTVNGTQTVLIDGVVTKQDITHSGSKPTLTVTGLDLLHVMSYMPPLFSYPPGTPYPAMPDFMRVYAIAGKYSLLGMFPLVYPSPLLDFPNPLEHIPQHQGSDLHYVQYLANEVGYAFYHSPSSTMGLSVAYWGPEIKIGRPQPALNVDMDAHTNVESINFSFDNTAKKLPFVMYLNKESNIAIPIPIPDITPLSPPLGLIPPIPHEFDQLKRTAKYSLIQTAAVALAKAAQSAQAVTATGSLDVLRYGRVLQARELVGVRGAGTAFDGLYYVKSVTHKLKRGEYKQDFTLTRNGLVSTLSEVPP